MISDDRQIPTNDVTTPLNEGAAARAHWRRAAHHDKPRARPVEGAFRTTAGSGTMPPDCAPPAPRLGLIGRRPMSAAFRRMARELARKNAPLSRWRARRRAPAVLPPQWSSSGEASIPNGGCGWRWRIESHDAATAPDRRQAWVREELPLAGPDAAIHSLIRHVDHRRYASRTEHGGHDNLGLR
jgi:hypothetical protein